MVRRLSPVAASVSCSLPESRLRHAGLTTKDWMRRGASAPGPASHSRKEVRPRGVARLASWFGRFSLATVRAARVRVTLVAVAALE